MGALHRAIRINCRDHEIRAALEDDFHHFRVLLAHAHGRITRVETSAPRTPYTLCTLAGHELTRLVGAPLARSIPSTIAHTDAAHQCTHQLDLAAIAIAAAFCGATTLRYDITVHDPIDGIQRALLHRNDSLVLDWQVARYTIQSPAPYAGQSLGAGFTRWVTDTLPPEQAEAALILRRGVFVSGGRAIPLATTVWPARAAGACWVQQPERAHTAINNIPFRVDFSTQPELLTAADQIWLNPAGPPPEPPPEPAGIATETC